MLWENVETVVQKPVAAVENFLPIVESSTRSGLPGARRYLRTGDV
jgi:hypothetical protein